MQDKATSPKGEIIKCCGKRSEGEAEEMLRTWKGFVPENSNVVIDWETLFSRRHPSHGTGKSTMARLSHQQIKNMMRVGEKVVW